MKRLLFVLVAMLGLCLAGCGKYHGKYGGKYYNNNAQTISPIRVPHGVASPVAQQYYSIPWKVEGKANPKLSLLPPDENFKRRLAEKHKAKAKH